MKRSYFLVLFTALGVLVQALLPSFVTANQSLLKKSDLRDTYHRLEAFGKR